MSAISLPLRLVCTEGVPEQGLLYSAARLAGIPAAEFQESVRSASKRLRDLLRLKRALSIADGALKVTDCAGLIRLSPQIELEVAPKFLGADDASWREDFFLIATIVRKGAILPRERLRADSADRSDLASLVGRAMVELYRDNQRRPLRTYRLRAWNDFVVEGEIDPEDLMLPDAEGFRQEGVTLDRGNRYNAIIRAAVRTLLPEVLNAGTRLQLMRVFEELSPQTDPSWPSRQRTVPSRHRNWQPLYDLSRQVLEGLGIALNPGSLHAPGYVLNTWSAWEDLILHALHVGLGENRVSGKISYPLGRRNGREFVVTPDITVIGGCRTTLVDAKYKAALKQKRTRIGEADVYEALAFMEAAAASRTLLIYPRVPRGQPRLAPGSCRLFDRIDVDEKQILGLEVECRNIGAKGFQSFSEALAAEIGPSVL